MKKVVIDKAQRLYQLPPGVSSFIRAEKGPSLLRRMSLLDIGSFGWPVDFPKDALQGSVSLGPAGREKLDHLKEEIAAWFASYHGVRLNPATEIHVGGRLSHLVFQLALAFIDNGDIAFVPDVGIPLYRRVVAACGGEAIPYPVTLKNDWRPDFRRVNSRLGRVARLLFVNSPHNPTGSEMGEKAMEELLLLAGRENILVVNDAAYQSISGRKPVSLLSLPGARKIGVEVYSFAYAFGMPPVPFGFVVGNREVISGLEDAAGLVPCHIPEYYVTMAISSIRHYPADGLKAMRRLVQHNGPAVSVILELLSLEKCGFDGVPFTWAKIERRRQATSAAMILHRRSRVLAVPGTAFGDNGEGFLRFSLTAPSETYQEAAERIKKRPRLIRLGKDE
jgi:aspartate/methionine/tyrosine aminotransferase